MTAPGKGGRSTIVTDETVAPLVFRHMPGFRVAVLATTPAAASPAGNAARADPAAGSIVPAPGGATFVIITFPPDTVLAAPEFDGAAAGREMSEKLPGFAELFEADHPGMHRTPTIDHAVLLSGELCLELGDGSLTPLQPGDTVIQNGARHAWRNRSADPARLAVVLIGARSDAP